jgi:hypothetical protein
MAGRCMAKLGRFDEAEPYLLKGYDGLMGNPRASIEYQYRVLEWIVELYEDWDKPNQAEAWRGKLPAHIGK